MKITKKIVQKTAHLARISFDEVAEGQMINDLQNMVNWMDKLAEVDTENVAPLTEMSQEKNQFREDVEASHLTREQALKNSPKQDGEYFQVPKVIGD